MRRHLHTSRTILDCGTPATKSTADAIPGTWWTETHHVTCCRSARFYAHCVALLSSFETFWRPRKAATRNFQLFTHLPLQERKFYAHRIALLASSDTFRAMFDGHYKEKEASVIPIPNIRFAVFERMMRCIYTGEAPAAKCCCQRLHTSTSFLAASYISCIAVHLPSCRQCARAERLSPSRCCRPGQTQA